MTKKYFKVTIKSYFFFFFYNFITQGCIKLSDSKDIYNVAKNKINKCSSFELYKTILKKKKNPTLLYNNSNLFCYMSSKLAYWNYFNLLENAAFPSQK